jgi:hypothetical protein
MEIGLGVFQDPLLLSTYQGDPPYIPPLKSAQVCTIANFMAKPTPQSTHVTPIPKSTPYMPPMNEQPKI